MNRQQGATAFLSEKMCGISKSDFEFPHIADIKQKLSVLNNAIKVPSGPRFSKQLLFCKNAYFLRFSAKNTYFCSTTGTITSFTIFATLFYETVRRSE